MLLRRAYIARVFEGDPRMTGFEQHGQHLAPQPCGLYLLEQLEFATGNLGFIGQIGAFKFRSEFVMQATDAKDIEGLNHFSQFIQSNGNHFVSA